MKKLTSVLLAGCICMTALTLSSCNSKEKKVREFTDRFAGFVEDNERDSILAYYPKAELIDTLSLDYDPADLKIEKGEKDGQFIVNFGDDKNMTVKVSDTGKIKIVESNGLIKVSKAKLKFAKATGAMKNVKNDADLAKHLIIVDNLSTELFNKYVEKHKNAVVNLGYTTTYSPMYGMEEGKGYYTLRNNSDEDLTPDDYNITWSSEWMYAGMDNQGSKTEVKPGVAIKAHGTAQIPSSFTWHYSEDIKAITMRTPSQDEFFEKYQPTGDEYADYVAAHGDDVEASAKLGEGPYDMAGVIGKNMKIHLHLDKGMKEGSYYYDKNGANATLSLKVKSFNRNTGELTLEEYNNRGDITGNFVGTLTTEGYTGKMTAFSGKSYNFTLKIL